MATKKSSKKQSSARKGAAKKAKAAKAKAANKKTDGEDPGVPANPPIILGGGSILIFSDKKLVAATGSITYPDGFSAATHPYVLMYPDAAMHPGHVHHRRRRGTTHSRPFINATDSIVVEGS